MIADSRQKLADVRTKPEGSGAKKGQRSVLQAMLEARDDDGNPVSCSGTPPPPPPGVPETLTGWPSSSLASNIACKTERCPFLAPPPSGLMLFAASLSRLSSITPAQINSPLFVERWHKEHRGHQKAGQRKADKCKGSKRQPKARSQESGGCTHSYHVRSL